MEENVRIKMSVDNLVSILAFLEGKKSQVKVGDLRETVRLLSLIAHASPAMLLMLRENGGTIWGKMSKTKRVAFAEQWEKAVVYTAKRKKKKG